MSVVALLVMIEEARTTLVEVVPSNMVIHNRSSTLPVAAPVIPFNTEGKAHLVSSKKVLLAGVERVQVRLGVQNRRHGAGLLY